MALDSVQTPEGESAEALGGSAVYFSLAARHFAPVRMVGVVGTDFPDAHRELLIRCGVDIAGLQAVPGRTFRWVGRFGKDFNRAQTLDTQLNVFEKFDPRLSPEQASCSVLFLANIDPDLQRRVLEQMAAPKLVVCDTMNFWIGLKRKSLEELLTRIDVLIVNEEEAQQLSGDSNNVRAGLFLTRRGPRVVVVKKGEHGVLCVAGGVVHPLPAFPMETVKDPTGAGDSFAGAFVGALAEGSLDLRDIGALKRALAYGAVVSSVNVSDFSTRALETLTRPVIEERLRGYRELVNVS